ncbi:MAG TPA: hypothetical protein PKW98_19120 [Candidatus Wallbacteria bacterium]|nr:hypothetical protein [Bacteroidales bacterium]OQA81623.1 MAG: hypothetical protein BWY32_00003 [bacterium ADurb.Bin243]HPG59938.1 hypothetical protein [Candidatus Wallbacteria bacterium]
MTNSSFLTKLFEQMQPNDYVQLLIFLIIGGFLIIFNIVFVIKLLSIPDNVLKIKNAVNEITSRVTKIEGDIKDLYRTANSIESLKGVMVEIAEINKNTVSGSKQIIEQLISINKNLEKINDKSIIK